VDANHGYKGKIMYYKHLLFSLVTYLGLLFGTSDVVPHQLTLQVSADNLLMAKAILTLITLSCSEKEAAAPLGGC
jgi:hypothetical protein